MKYLSKIFETANEDLFFNNDIKYIGYNKFSVKGKEYEYDPTDIINKIVSMYHYFEDNDFYYASGRRTEKIINDNIDTYIFKLSIYNYRIDIVILKDDYYFLQLYDSAATYNKTDIVYLIVEDLQSIIDIGNAYHNYHSKSFYDISKEILSKVNKH